MDGTIKISFVLPSTLQHDLKKSIVDAGYSLKQKSRWISEAIQSLLEIKTLPELIKINDVMSGFEKFESAIIDKTLKTQIDAAVVAVRKVYPQLEGVQSKIVRTAIVQRIIRHC